MSRIAGRLGRVAVSSDGGQTFYDVDCIVDMSLSASQAELNVTCHASGQYEEYIPGRKEATMDLSLHWDEEDAGATILTDAYFSGTPLMVRYRPDEGSGKAEFLANGFVTSYNATSPNDDVADLEVSIRLSGQFDQTTQA